MKHLLIGLAALPFVTGGALAANRLTDAQLDMITAGQVLGIECPGCTLASSSSSSTNGQTTSTSSTQIVGGGGASGGGSGGGGSGGGGGGDTGGGDTGGGTGGGGSTGPSVSTTLSVPSNLAAIVKNATTIVLGQ